MDQQELQRRRVQRAAERRRRARRRQVGAIGALLAVIAVVVLVVSAASGGSSHKPEKRAALDVTTHHRARRHAAAARGRGGSTAAALPKGNGTPGTASVPILMYHVIAPPPTGAPFPGLYVPAPEFTAQMQALKADGWVGVTLDQLWANWKTGAKLPPGKPVVITFDNGYHSQYASALPVLRHLHWPADENIQLTGLPPSQGGLTSAEIRAMVNSGWELDTQGISHADLIALSPAALHAQVVSSRQTIRHEYHVPVNWFCYPSGHYNATVIDTVRGAGYLGSTTVIPGWASPSSDSYRLPRLRVLSGTSPSALLDQIATNRTAAPPPGSYGGT